MLKPLMGVAVAALLTAAPAQAYEVAAGARISTLGLGLELATNVAPKWDVRGVINGFNYSKSSVQPAAHQDPVVVMNRRKTDHIPQGLTHTDSYRQQQKGVSPKTSKD